MGTQSEIAKAAFDSGMKVTRLQSALDAALADNAALVEMINDLIYDSAGVYGLHLNGDPAPWAELMQGGRFEEWLINLAQPHPGAALLAERDRLRKALEWYAEQARLCRLVHSEGDSGRNALANDGGAIARAALAKEQQS